MPTHTEAYDSQIQSAQLLGVVANWRLSKSVNCKFKLAPEKQSHGNWNLDHDCRHQTQFQILTGRPTELLSTPHIRENKFAAIKRKFFHRCSFRYFSGAPMEKNKKYKIPPKSMESNEVFLGPGSRINWPIYIINIEKSVPKWKFAVLHVSVCSAVQMESILIVTRIRGWKM